MWAATRPRTPPAGQTCTAELSAHQVVAPAVEVAVGRPATGQGELEVFDLSFLSTESNTGDDVHVHPPASGLCPLKYMK